MIRTQVPSERKLLTVLVVDVVGSTALAETMDPEEWTGIVFGAHERMTAAIHRAQGTVAQFTGDGLIALFGTPRTREDDAVRAVRAALDIQKLVADYERELIAAHRLPHFAVRIGLHSGIVLLGDASRAQYSELVAVGDTVPTAQRVQSAGQPGAVVVSDETASMIRSAFALAPLAESEPGGVPSPRLWLVVGEQDAVDGRANSPLVGREREIQILRAALSRLQEGRGALVSIVGEPGIGKSRLVQELRQQAPALVPDAHWFEARGLSYEGGLYSLFQQILRASLGIRGTDSVEAIRQRLRLGAARQKFQDPDLVVHMLELFLAIEPGKDQRFAALEGEALKRELFATVRHTKQALAQNRPTVFVLEDMHWADAASIELTLNDADLVRELPILILATFRPDRDAPSWNYRQECGERFADVYQEINLESLPPAEARQLLDAIPGAEALSEQARALILDRAEGNPFFLEQVLEMWREAGGTTDPAATPTIPNSVNVILAARLDRLGEPTHRVIQAAAVIGRSFPRELLFGVVRRMGWDDVADALDLHLAVLERQQLTVRDSSDVPAFKHALIRQAAYDTILRKRRLELHRAALHALQETYAGRLEEHAAELAYHAQVGEEWTSAYEYARRAGENAARVSAVAEAAAQYRRALGALGKLDEPETAKAQARADLERALQSLNGH